MHDSKLNLMSTRFVILQHKTSDGEHWDLMLERGEMLLTWQLPRAPRDGSDFPMPARRIADHRKRYLAYQGPIGGGRGEVRRVDAGTVEFQEFTAASCRIRLRGGRLRGEFSLEREGDTWVIGIVQLRRGPVGPIDDKGP